MSSSRRTRAQAVAHPVATVLATTLLASLGVGGCLLSLSFDDLTKGGPPTADAADASDTNEEADAFDDVGDGRPDTPAHCADKAMNEDETDIDCGGADCLRCTPGRKCTSPSDCTTQNCDGGRCAACPVSMLKVAVSPYYCIDTAEVTVAAYRAFYTKVKPSGVTLHLACKWKLGGSFEPKSPELLGADDLPVRNVDWCDAYQYCDAQGKRLCGLIGGSGKAPSPYDQYDNPYASQWRHACSPNTGTSWPYGTAYVAGKCNTVSAADAAVGAVRSVRSFPACVGATLEFSTLYDMSGNVAEWEDSCMGSSGDSDSCRVRGGSYFDKDPTQTSCSAATIRTRRDRQDWVGFRCCRF